MHGDSRHSRNRVWRGGRGGSGGAVRGFTIVELLLVVAIIILLMSILIVAVQAATRTGQKARTEALMDSIRKGLIRFKGDIGYYPPVLGPGANPVDELRQLFVPPLPGAGGYNANIQQWWSSCALADYLIGWDGHNHDGYGRVPGAVGANDWDAESPPVGIRNPQDDGVWYATRNGFMNGSLNDRMMIGNTAGTETNQLSIDQGKVFGPYLELKDERLLAAISGYDGAGQPILHFPGDPVPNGTTFETLPKVIVDYWGTPIRYYRRNYPIGALTQSYRSVNGQRVPTLSDVFVLRPQTFKRGSEIIGIPDNSGTTATTSELENGEFALLSAGPDKRVTQGITIDLPNEFNKDNIVEVGP